MSTELLQDADIQLDLLAQLIWDGHWLRAVGDRVEKDDFREISKTDSMLWIIAGKAVEFFRKHRVPIGNLIGPEMMRWCDKIGASEERRERVKKFVGGLRKIYDPRRSKVLVEAFAGWKEKRLLLSSLYDAADLARTNQLTVEKFQEIAAALPRNGNRASIGIRASTIKPQPVRWLERNRIPLGGVTALDGDPGTAKSTLACDYAARTSQGTLEGDLEGTKCGVVMMTAEDTWTNIVIPRLQYAGADLTRVSLLAYTPRENGDIAVDTITDVAKIERAIVEVDAKLVVVDVLMAYLPDRTDSHNNHQIRRAIAPLAQLAERLGVAVIVIRHLNKQRGGNPLYRGEASIGINRRRASRILSGKRS